MCILIIYFNAYDAINFEISLGFLFPKLTKMSEQKFKYLQNENSLIGKIKIILKGFQLPEIVSDLRVNL